MPFSSTQKGIQRGGYDGPYPHLSYSMKLALLLGTTEGPTLIS
jgi:hypothetical protein